MTSNTNTSASTGTKVPADQKNATTEIMKLLAVIGLDISTSFSSSNFLHDFTPTCQFYLCIVRALNCYILTSDLGCSYISYPFSELSWVFIYFILSFDVMFKLFKPDFNSWHPHLPTLFTLLCIFLQRRYVNKIRPNFKEPKEKKGDKKPWDEYKPSKMHVIRTLAKFSIFARPCRFAIMFISAIIMYAAEAAKPYMIGKAFDEGFSKDHDVDIFTWISRFIFFATIYLVFCTLQGFMYEILCTELPKKFKAHILKKILSFETAFFDTANSGELGDKLNKYWILRHSFNLVRMSLEMASTITVIGYITFSQNPRLALVTIIPAPFLVWWVHFRSTIVQKFHKKEQKIEESRNKVCHESVNNIREVKLFNTSASEQENYENITQRLIEYIWEHDVYFIAGWLVHAFCENFSTVAVVYFGTALYQQGQVTVGEMAMFMSCASRLSFQIRHTAWIVKEATLIFDKSSTLFYILDRENNLPLKDCRRPEKFEASIEFDDVEFAYPKVPDKQVLKCLNLKIEPGKVVALVGESGSGKSSFMRLLIRLYDPDEGRVCVGGIPVNCYDPEYLSSMMTMVPQEGKLFARTIRENIIYGCTKKISEAEIIDAAKKANAHEFILELEDEDGNKGYDAKIGEGGATLSGGQKQRVNIARALVRKPAILLLDEATSALDSTSERLVQSSIDDIMLAGDVEMTIVVIAHRLSTVQNCDEIFVIGDGKVVETGTHQSLILQGGAYAKLVEDQTLDPVSKHDGISKKSATRRGRPLVTLSTTNALPEDLDALSELCPPLMKRAITI